MSPSTTLFGTLTLGGGSLLLGASIGGSAPVTFHGEAASAIHFTQMVAELLGSAYLHLPDDFPQVIFNFVQVDLIAGRSLSIRARSTVSWPRPFAVLDGLSFTNLTLAFATGTAVPTFLAFSGTVLYGSFVDLEGQILFADGTLMVAGARIATPIPIVDFLSWSMPSLNWGDLLPISLGPRSADQPLRIYYARDTFDDYQAGFNVDRVHIEILGFAAAVSLRVKDGVTLSGSLDNAIDFAFMRLGGPGDAGGPGVAVQCTAALRSFQLSVDIVFLAKAALSTGIAVRRVPGGTGYELSGRIEFQTTIAPFGRPQFAFTWSKQSGFRVDTWSIPDFPGAEFLDLVQVLNKLSSNSCAVFTREMFRKAIQVRFSFAAAMDSDAGTAVAAAGGLNFTVGGSYTISVPGVADAITLPLPFDLKVRLSTPEEFSFEALAGALGQAIVQAAEALLAQIVADPARSAKFFAVVITQAALPQVIAMVLCRGWLPPAPPPPPPPPPPTVPVIPSWPPSPPPPPGPGGSPGTVVVTSLQCEATALLATWEKAEHAMGYRAVVRNDTAELQLVDEVDADRTTIQIPDDFPSTTYGFNIQAFNEVGVGDWSDLRTFNRLAAVIGVTLVQAGPSLVLTWQRRSEHTPYTTPGSYDYRVYDPAGNLFAGGSTGPDTFSVALALPPGAAAGRYASIVRAAAPDGAAIASQWSEEAGAEVDPAIPSGWLVSLFNSLAVGLPDSLLTARVLEPPAAGTTTIDAQQTASLSPTPITGFQVWRTFPATSRCRTVQGYLVTATTSGKQITLSWADIVNGGLPSGFTGRSRTGILVDHTNLLWADLFTVNEMAGALQPVTSAATDLASLLVHAYPDVAQASLCTALALVAYDVADLVAGLLGVRAHYSAHGNPVTPASACLAIASALAQLGTPLTPPLAAAALLPTFAAIGEPLDAVRLAGALATGFPLSEITAATLLPFALALRNGGFALADAARGLAQAYPAAAARSLAGALKPVWLGPTPTAEQYARYLHDQGMSAQQASPILARGYAWIGADELALLLVDSFPETTTSAVLVCWCLGAAAIAEAEAARALVATISDLPAGVLAAALKTTYPSPGVLRLIGTLVAAGRTAPQAAILLAADLPDYTATQLGWLLIVFFTATAPDPLGMTIALHAATCPMSGAAMALHRLFPLLTAAAIAALLKAVYLSGEI